MEVVVSKDIVATTTHYAARLAEQGGVTLYVSNYTHLHRLKRAVDKDVCVVYADWTCRNTKPTRLILVQPQWIENERLKVILLGLFLSPETDAVIITNDEECAWRIRHHINHHINQHN